MPAPEWWRKPRKISVVVDNDSWILPYAEQLVARYNKKGDRAKLCRKHSQIKKGSVAFYLGCVKITPPTVLARNRRNLVIHASDLPKGRGFSPWTYAILEGKNKIPVCLIDAAEKVDAGEIIYKDSLKLKGNELVGEVRDLLGKKTVELCSRFLDGKTPKAGKKQKGKATVYKRRGPKDSRLDPVKSIEKQFNLLRVVDNGKYPAFFEYRGRRYKLLIEPDERDL